jgi:hypothetical protein
MFTKEGVNCFPARERAISERLGQKTTSKDSKNDKITRYWTPNLETNEVKSQDRLEGTEIQHAIH